MTRRPFQDLQTRAMAQAFAEATDVLTRDLLVRVDPYWIVGLSVNR